MNSCKIIFYAFYAFSSEKKLSKKGLAASSAADGKTSIPASISKTIDWISLKNKSSIFDIIDGRGEGKENIKNIKGWRFFRDESIEKKNIPHWGVRYILLMRWVGEDVESVHKLMIFFPSKATEINNIELNCKKVLLMMMMIEKVI